MAIAPALFIRADDILDFQIQPALGDLSKLIGPTDIPTQSLQNHVENQLASAEHALRQLEDEIFKVQSHLYQLSEHRKQRLSYITHLRATVGAQKRLPPELLTKIFRSCRDDDNDSITISPSVEPNAFPWNVTRVCSRWRQVALNDPFLWNQLHVIVREGCDIHRIDVMIKTALRMSRNVGLYLHVEAPSLDSFVHRLINDAAHRLVSLSLSLRANPKPTATSSSSFTAVPTSTLVPTPFPTLQSLDLFCDYSRYDLRDFLVYAIPTLFIDAPSLSHLSISSRALLPPLDIPFYVRLPWDQLTSLDLRRLPLYADDAHSVLRRCPNLIECALKTELDLDGVLTLFGPPDGGSTSSGTLVLPRLESLDLTVDHDGITPSVLLVLRPLVLPALRTVVLSAVTCARVDRTAAMDDLRALLERSGCRVERLHFLSWDFDVQLDVFVESLPGLVSVRAKRGRVSGAMMGRVGRREVGMGLEEVECVVCVQDVEVFVEMVRRRWTERGVGSLKYVRVRVELGDTRLCGGETMEMVCQALSDRFEGMVQNLGLAGRVVWSVE